MMKLKESIHHLIKSNNYLHALKLCYSFKERSKIAKEAVECWIQLGNYPKAMEWSTYLGEDPLVKERLLKAYQEHLLFHDVCKRMYEKNLSALKAKEHILHKIRSYRKREEITWAKKEGKPLILKVEENTLSELSWCVGGNEILQLLEQIKSVYSLIFVGMRSIELLHAVYHLGVPQDELSSYTSVKQCLYIVEKSLDVFILLLHLYDLTELLSSERVFLFIGEDWKRECKDFFSNLRVNLPERIICIEKDTGYDVRHLLDYLGRRRAQILEEKRRQIDINCSPSWEKDLRRKFAKRHELKVLLHTSRFTTVLQYCTKDMEEGFKEAGCRTRLLIEKKDTEWLNLPYILGEIAEFKPDMIFMIDNIRPHFRILNTTIPFVCWVQDWLPRLFREEYIKKLSKRDFTYALLPHMRDECLKAGYKRVKMMPPAVNPKIYSFDAKIEEDLLCDVAFVGHCPQNTNDPIASYLKRNFFEGKEGQIEWDIDSCAELIRKAAKDLGMDVSAEKARRLSVHYMINLLKPMQRVQVLLWAKELGVKIKLYGKFWENFEELKEFAMGPVPNRSEKLKSVYRSAKVHLQISPDINFHFRTIECFASGGFILANAHPNDHKPGGLNDYLKIGEEIITFEGKEDFQEKLLYYLKNEDEREKIAEAARERIKREHTYFHRALSVIEDVRRSL
jgi:glycosyltransferase involved in cell wall biosynthesis